MPTTSLPPLFTRLRQLRIEAGLTQARLAELAGVNLATVRNLDQGHRCEPVWGNMWRLAGALAEALGRSRWEVLEALRPAE